MYVAYTKGSDLMERNLKTQNPDSAMFLSPRPGHL
jgi:hypothetical protein